MSGAAWVRWVFAAMFVALAVFYVVRFFMSNPGRPARGGSRAPGVDIARGLMSVGMVAMLVPGVDPLPRLWWQLLFGLAAGYIGVRLVRRRLGTTRLPLPNPGAGGHHELHLVIGSAAMVYMLAAMPAGQQMADGMDMAQMGPTGLAVPVLTWAFVAYFVVFVVRLAARLAVPVTSWTATPAGAAVVSPHLLGSTEVVMGIGMSYMLLLML